MRGRREEGGHDARQASIGARAHRRDRCGRARDGAGARAGGTRGVDRRHCGSAASAAEALARVLPAARALSPTKWYATATWSACGRR